MGEIPKVEDFNDKERARRFSQRVANVLNSLFNSQQLVRTGPDSFNLSPTLPDSGVTPGSYTSTDITVNAKGIITAAASGGGGGGGDPISSIYPVFTPTGDDDEFSSGSFSGWTAVNPGTNLPTLTQVNNVLSVNHPGGDSGTQLHAWMKTRSIAAGDYVECAMRSFGPSQNFHQGGVLFADGTTYGAGVQTDFFESPSDQKLAIGSLTNYNNQSAATTATYEWGASRADVFLRLVYNGSNSFTGLVSCDGISWVTAVTRSTTLTPTAAGFFVTTSSGALPFMWSFRYVRFGP